MFDDVTLKEMIKALLKKIFRVRRWKSLNFGIEIGMWMIAIYFILWSVEVGVRTKEDRIG